MEKQYASSNEVLTTALCGLCKLSGQNLFAFSYALSEIIFFSPGLFSGGLK